jgi:F-type H+-transporting ATPase subunit epsilon
MIPDNLQVQIVTPTRLDEKYRISYVRAPGLDGLFGVMPGHVPAIIALDIGEIGLQQGNNREYWATGGGYAEVHQDKVILLVESAELATDIDIARAEQALNRAQQRLKAEDKSEIDLQRARKAYQRAKNRLSVANRA